MACDFNCKNSDWGKKVNNTNGNSLKEWLKENKTHLKSLNYDRVNNALLPELLNDTNSAAISRFGKSAKSLSKKCKPE